MAKVPISIVPKILEFVAQAGDIFKVIKAALVGFEAFKNELNDGKSND